MKLITIAQARDHVKADGDDDDLLIAYCDAAEAACARIANRNLYATSGALATAIAGVSASMQTAYATYDAAVLVADAHDDERLSESDAITAQRALTRATVNAENVVNGLALDDPDNADIISAILLTVGHFYRNRESVVTGQGAAAVEVPLAVQSIMRNHRWNGPL